MVLGALTGARFSRHGFPRSSQVGWGGGAGQKQAEKEERLAA